MVHQIANSCHWDVSLLYKQIYPKERQCPMMIREFNVEAKQTFKCKLRIMDSNEIPIIPIGCTV